MDPNAALDLIAIGSVAERNEALFALREWLARGGFEPLRDTPAREDAWVAYLAWTA